MKGNPPATWSLRLLFCPAWSDQASFHSQPAPAAAPVGSGSGGGKGAETPEKGQVGRVKEAQMIK